MLMAIAAHFSLYGQRKYYPLEKYWGITGGITQSMMQFAPSVKQNLLTGYHSGIAFRYINIKNLGFQAELNLNQRGWLENGGVFSRRLDYGELALLSHINFGNRFRFFVNIGPTISYLINQQIVIPAPPSSTLYQHKSEISNPFEYGLAAGFGFYLRFHKQLLQAEARAYYGANAVYDTKPADAFDYANNINARITVAWFIKTSE